MHPEARAFVAQMRPQIASGARIVEFGGRQVNGGVRDLFGDCFTYHAIDIRPGPGVDRVADAATWQPGPGGWCDVVICTEVLEHAPDPGGIVANAYRVLAPGGALILTCATEPRGPHSGVDGGPVRPGEHYGNVDPDALEQWLAPFAAGGGTWQLEVHHDRGDLYAWARKGER